MYEGIRKKSMSVPYLKKWCGVGKVWGSASVFQMKSRMWTEPVHKFFVSSGCWGGGVDSVTRPVFHG